MLKNIMEGAALLETVLTVEQDMSWTAQGRCGKHADPDLWFAPVEASSPRYAHLEGDAVRRARLRDRNKAKEICHACPVRVQCLKYAMDHMGPMDPADEEANGDGRHGIWGGLDKTERTKLRNMLADKEAAA